MTILATVRHRLAIGDALMRGRARPPSRDSRQASAVARPVLLARRAERVVGSTRRPRVRASMLTALALCAGLFGPAAALAARADEGAALAEARRLMGQSHERFRSGALFEAETMLLQALVLVEGVYGPDHVAVAEPLWGLGAVYHVRGDGVRAAAVLRRVLALRERALGPEHPETAKALKALADVLVAGERPDESEPVRRQLLTVQERTLGPGDPAVATTLYELARHHDSRGEFVQAEALVRRALAIRDAALGPTHPEVAIALQGLADILDALGRPGEAEPHWRRLLAVQEQILGPDDPALAIPLTALGRFHARRHEYGPAEPLLARALSLYETARGPAHLDVASVAVELARVLEARERYGAAEALARRAFEIRRQMLGEAHLDVAESLEVLGGVYVAQGRYVEAEPLLVQSVRTTVEILGRASPVVVPRVIRLAHIYLEQGLYRRAEPLLEESLRIREAALAPQDPLLAQSLHNLAVLRGGQGRYAEAVQLSIRALALVEKATGADSFETATVAASLGQLYMTVGQHDQAEAILRRALTSFERVLGPTHLRVAGVSTSLAGADLGRRRVTPAIAHLERAAQIIERVLGPEHPDLATALNNLAQARHLGGQWREAEPLLWHALRIRERAMGSADGSVAVILSNLGDTLRALGRPGEAEPLQQRALVIAERTMAPGDVRRAAILTGLAVTVEETGRLADARGLHERARHAFLAIARTQWDLDEAEQRTLRRSSRPALVAYAALLARLARDPGRLPGDGAPELDAFVVAEQARISAAGGALARAAARVATGDRAAAALARAAQDLLHQREAVRRLLVRAHGQDPATRDAAHLAALERTVHSLDGEVAQATTRLLETVPAYGEMMAPEPLTADAVRRLLRPGEALLSYYTLTDRMLVWLLRADAPPVYREVAISRDALVEIVARVRRSLAQDAVALGQGLTAVDVEGAHHLYTLLVAPLEPHLHAIGSLLVVPDEVLAPVPFAALVTRPEGAAFTTLAARHAEQRALEPAELLAHASVAWLGGAYSISVLPAATSLRALRQSPVARPAAAEPFLGFGDPVLSGYGRRRGGEMLPGPAGTADPEALRRLNALPGTREELRALATALGADAGTAVFLGPQATETTIRQLDAAGRLGGARVLAFATHGLLAGELGAFAQPALVMTPPVEPSEADDGLLSLEEVLGLRLTSTEWVVLSACNTGADDGSGESLAGLARAFFFAGARTLLVSHWAVEDRATQVLMGEVFRRFAAGMAPAEALRAGLLAMMGHAQGRTAYLAHPFAWAPFTVVGEGR